MALLCACNDRVTGQQPVGGAEDTDASIQRFLRRATLDLSGHPPSDGDMTSQTAALRSQGDTASARGALVDQLMAKDEFATTYVF